MASFIYTETDAIREFKENLNGRMADLEGCLEVLHNYPGKRDVSLFISGLIMYYEKYDTLTLNQAHYALEIWTWCKNEGYL